MIAGITQFNFPTVIRFGPGSRWEVGPQLQSRGLKRPLIVTDRGVAGLATFAKFVSKLSTVGLETSTYSGVQGNPVKTQVNEGLKVYREHRADSIIGIGGGAALDVAKAIALLVNHPGDLFDYEDGKGGRPVNLPIPFWVGLPTTSGTGSEVGRSSVISDDQTHEKKIIFSPSLLAKIVFADPELTLELPPKLTAATGMDALTHCIESYLAKDYHPLCDGVALEGLKIAGRALPKAVGSPGDLAARAEMMMAALMGAVAFQKGLGLVHSCAHALSIHADTHHGLANGVMIDHALPYNARVAEDRFKAMGTLLGLKKPSAEGFVQWLKDLKETIGIPEGLSGIGLTAKDVPRLSKLAFADSCHQNNPRPVAETDFEEIFSAAARA